MQAVQTIVLSNARERSQKVHIFLWMDLSFDAGRCKL